MKAAEVEAQMKAVAEKIREQIARAGSGSITLHYHDGRVQKIEYRSFEKV